MIKTAKRTNYIYPIKNNILRKDCAIRLEKCPECGGSLDTGWECNDCHFDAFPLVSVQFGLSREVAAKDGAG